MAAEHVQISARDVWFSYPGAAPTLQGLSLDVGSGDCVALVGPNGSGKSTLLSCLSGTRRPSRGDVSLDGRPLRTIPRREMATRVAVLPQGIPTTAPFTVEEIVQMGRFPYRGLLGAYTDADRRAVDEALRRTGTSGFRGKVASELSGGERQRVFLAKTLCQEPRILLLDEPTGSLDLRYQVAILSLVRDLHQADGIGVLAVLHDVNLAALFFDRVVVLDAGSVVADGSAEEVLTRGLLRDVYGVRVDVQKGASGRPQVLLDVR
jgi:iron complex transport system ATP-binding protein